MPKAVGLKHQDSMTSHCYYGFHEESVQESGFLQGHCVTSSTHSTCTKQSGRLPLWTWKFIARCLGVPVIPNERPVLGTIIHILTFASALTYAVAHTWYVAYDIASVHTKQNAQNGTVSIILVFCWCSFGFYSKTLSGRLFHHPRFTKDIRMHARTFFKINAAFLVFLLGAVFTVISNINGLESFYDRHCEMIDLSKLVCKVEYVARVIFSAFSLLWITLVAIVLISVCRTHTIGIRRFIRDLEYDAVLYAKYNSHVHQFQPVTKEDICQETIWLEEQVHESGDLSDSADSFVLIHTSLGGVRRHSRSFAPLVKENTHTSSHDKVEVSPNQNIPVISQDEGDANLPELEGGISIIARPILEEVQREEILKDNENESSSADARPNNVKKLVLTPNTDDNLNTNAALSIAEILHNYWKISCRLRLSSSALQRWVTSYIALVIAWCSVYLVYWVNNSATVYDVIQFIVPLILLPLLCSTLAEVNSEGQRLAKSICPTEHRLQLIKFLNQNPLQMTVYGYALNHGTIMTVFFAILVAFTSRLVVSEINT
ncbi:uncharacterized protein LOC106470240 [Limulus polyphemus]|uniref:Uncharacterized protein LOC106470240 n=1 Tax=Limulus polyphemus TaxID=6850 RepID=A0ABM1BPM4_LIMPO|nr:uncharacterized protein LOC106470240 [Limulus polyphemus]